MGDLRFLLNSLLSEVITKFFILPMVMVSANYMAIGDYNDAATIRIFVITLATVATQGLVLEVYRKLKVVNGDAVITVGFCLVFLSQMVLWGGVGIIFYLFNLISSIYECLVLFLLHSVMVILMSIYRKIDGNFLKVLIFVLPVFPLSYLLIRLFKLEGFIISYGLFATCVVAILFFSLKNRISFSRDGVESFINPIIVSLETWISLLFLFSLPTFFSILGGVKYIGDILMFHTIASIGLFFMMAILNGYMARFSELGSQKVKKEINKIWAFFSFFSVFSFLIVFSLRRYFFHFDYDMHVYISFYLSMLIQVLNCIQGFYYRVNGFYKRSLLHNCMLTIFVFFAMLFFYDGDVKIYSDIFFFCNLIVFLYIYIEKKIIGESDILNFVYVMVVLICFILSKNISLI